MDGFLSEPPNAEQKFTGAAAPRSRLRRFLRRLLRNRRFLMTALQMADAIAKTVRLISDLLR